MRRLVLFLMLIAACGGAAADGATTVTNAPAPAPSTTSGADSDGPAPTPGTAQPTTTVASDRQAAPDFTLVLASGGSYTLSEGAKPVYLVFWAEW